MGVGGGRERCPQGYNRRKLTLLMGRRLVETESWGQRNTSRGYSICKQTGTRSQTSLRGCYSTSLERLIANNGRT